MTQAAVPIRFYDCPFKSFEETISECDAPLYDWLVSITPPRPYWTPQEVKRLQIYSDVLQQIIDDQAACVESRMAQQNTPDAGVSISVATVSNAGGSRASSADDTLRASVPMQIAPQSGCPIVQFHILNKVNLVGNNRYNENTLISTTGEAPALNGINEFANAIIFASAMQTFGWRDVLHQVFTGGNWTIHSDEVFNHYCTWVGIDNPPPSADLLARMEAFAIADQDIDLTNFPGMTTPQWRVVHRYMHQQSGIGFWFSEWKNLLNLQTSSWPIVEGGGQWGRGFDGSFNWSSFVVPNEIGTEPFDPEGTWTHESLVVDFGGTVTGQVKYHGDLCDEFMTTFNEIGVFDPGTAAPLGAAIFSEIVEVKTIKQYKACYRITAINAVDSVGIRVSVKLINSFDFPTCIVARMPFGSGSKYDGKWLSSYTVIIVRNLAANTESPEIEFVLPILALDTGAVSYKMSDVIYDAQNGGGIVEHGFACANNAYTDRLTITSITSDALALPATSDGQKAHMWAFYNPAGSRFWSQFGASGQPSTDVVFSYTPVSTNSTEYESMKIRLYIEASGSFDGVSWARCTYKFFAPYGYMWVADGVASLNEIHIGLSRYGARQRYGDDPITSSAVVVNANDTPMSIFTDWNNGDSAELTDYLVSTFATHVKAWVEQAIKTQTGYRYAMAQISGDPLSYAGIGTYRSQVIALDDYTPSSPTPTDPVGYAMVTPAGDLGGYGGVGAAAVFLTQAGQTNAQMVIT